MQKEAAKPVFKWLSMTIGLIAISLAVVGALLVTRINSLELYVFLVIGLIGLAATLWKIEWGLFALVVMTYARISDVAVYFYGAPSLAQPFIAFLGLLILIRWLVNGETPQGWLQPGLYISAYGVVIFLSLIYASDPTRAQVGLINFLKDAIIAIMVVLLVQSKEFLRIAVWGFLAVGILLGSIAVFQYLTGTFGNPYWGLAESEVMNIVSRVEGYRIMGTFSDPNFFAQVMVVIIPLALNRVIYEKKTIHKFLALWSLTASFLTVIFTFSRGGFLALCLVLGLLLLWRKPPLVVVLSGLLILFLLIPFLPATYFERIQTILDYLPFRGADVRGEVSFRGRLSEYEVGWQMFKENPILGIGFENYPANYLNYSIKLGLDPRRTERSAHSLYLEILAEQGLVGMFFFGLVLTTVFKSLAKGQKIFHKIAMHDYADLVLAVQVGFVGYLSAAVFIHGAFPRNLWLLIGIGLAVAQMAVNEEDVAMKAFYKKRLELGEKAILKEGS
jgi:putative inorganic carbon (HCO3(-)) transporter